MKKKRLLKKVIIFLSILLYIAIALNTYLIFKYDVLPLKFLILYLVIICFIPLVIIYLALMRKGTYKRKLIFLIIEFIYLIVLIAIFYYLNITFGVIDKWSTDYDYETKTYYVGVLKSSNYKKIGELANKNIGYNKGVDEDIDDALKELQKNIKFDNQKYDSNSELFEALDEEKIQAFVMSQSFFNLFAEDNEEFSDKINILFEFTVKVDIDHNTKDVNVTKETFNIYISGIDSYGSITENTRSDVNIVASVNPVTNKILMINIPRDYYVDLYGTNQKDKLTHAGVYGIETSMKTIENLLGIEINYYVKVNYSALIKLVDALGGVEVYSNYDFYSTFEHYHFKKGYNTVNGVKALEFVRTRKAFLDGDRVRGENQEAMIEAIIKKACSSKVLLKYNDILKSIDGMFATNMSTSKITSLIKVQLDEMKSWNINSISLNGTDAHDYTYSAPGLELYVMVPNEDTIKEAQKALEEIKMK